MQVQIEEEKELIKSDFFEKGLRQKVEKKLVKKNIARGTTDQGS